MKETKRKWAVDKTKPPKEFVLPHCGLKATIAVGTGADAQKASRMAGDDQSLYQAALYSILVRIDGEALCMEDFADLAIEDYAEIGQQFSDSNFTSAPKM